VKINGNKQVFFLSVLLIISEIFNTDIVLIVTMISISILMTVKGIMKTTNNSDFLLFLICLLGILSGILASNNFDRNYFRDIAMTISPVVFIIFGKYLSYFSDKKIFLKSIMLTALFLSVRHVLLVINAVTIYGLDFQSLRGVAGNMSITTVVAFAMLCLPPESIPRFFTKKIWIIIILSSLILYVSRITIIMIFIFIFLKIIDSYYKKKNFVLIKASFLSISIFLSFFYFKNKIDNTELFIKFKKSFSEISSSGNTWDWITINNNWRGYEIFLIKQNFSNVSIIKKIIGNGFGSTLPLNVNILLGDNIFDSIPIFHNGYYYILFKVGIIGLCLLLLYIFFNIFKNIIRYVRTRNTIFLFLVGIFVTISITMYVISGFYNGMTMISLCMAIGYYTNLKNNESGYFLNVEKI